MHTLELLWPQLLVVPMPLSLDSDSALVMSVNYVDFSWSPLLNSPRDRFASNDAVRPNCKHCTLPLAQRASEHRLSRVSQRFSRREHW